MNTLLLVQIVIFIIFGLIISYYDLKYKKIPNHLVLLLILSGIAINFYKINIIVALITLFILYLYWFFELINAGDCKLIFGCYIYFSNIIVNFEFVNKIIIIILITILIRNFRHIKKFKLDIQEFFIEILFYSIILSTVPKTISIIMLYLVIYIAFKYIKKYLFNYFEYKSLMIFGIIINVILFWFISQISLIRLIMLITIRLGFIVLKLDKDMALGPHIILGFLFANEFI